jgi:serine phosphatase RsbU (regulator of sigma subunit)
MTRPRRTLLIIWLAALAVWITFDQINGALALAGRHFPPFGVLEALAIATFIALSCYWFALAVRFILRKLFWSVGRRLALSYFLIGVMPFMLFAVMLLVIGYSIAGVLSQAAYRAHRQQALSRLDQWNLEYTLANARPAGALPSLEIYDTADPDAEKKLPEWIRNQSFTGLVLREKQGALVSARVYEEDGRRHSIILVQPFNDQWRERLEQENGMIVAYTPAQETSSQRGVRINTDDDDRNYEISGTDDDSVFEQFFERAWQPNGVVWGDLTPVLANWTDGQPTESRLFTLVWNPWRNLIEFYFGGSEYARIVLGVIMGIASAMLLVYLPATMLALVLIFSISRAVNRIEKGTQAVERGDFTYRIRMKPRNQLGTMAQSFDRMTESISTLLIKVAEKERLQSEIDIAATIQRNLLPKEGPQFRGVSFSAHFEPTASIGGDYYDVFSLDHSRLAVAIGDVSGHGLSTGLVMAMVKAAITTLVEEGADEESMFRRLNELVFRSTEKRAFMTLAFTIFDLQRGTIRHTNAGHLYPYLIRSGESPRAVESSSLPLGVRAEIRPHTVELDLQEGDRLVYLSDGIIEAQDQHGEPFGFDKLEEILSAQSDTSPAEIQESILASVAMHAGGRPSDDDRTVMVLRFDQLATHAVEDLTLAGSASEQSGR